MLWSEAQQACWAHCWAAAAGDHISVLPMQHHMQEDINALAQNLGLAVQPDSKHKTTLDTPFDVEVFDDLPPAVLEGVEFG